VTSDRRSARRDPNDSLHLIRADPSAPAAHSRYPRIPSTSTRGPEAGDKFPPLTCSARVPRSYWLADGFTRFRPRRPPV